MPPQTPPRKSRSEIIHSPYFSPSTSSRSIERLNQRLLLLKPVLIQETVASDPWKLIIAVTLLNKTAGKLAIPVFWTLLEAWPTPWALSQASEPDLVALIRPLGTQNIRAKRLIALSRAYLQDPPCLRDMRPSRFPGSASISRKAGQNILRRPLAIYPAQEEEWKDVNPSDKELIRYLER
ncbi:DNA glycosylase [Mycena rebaudengoi]|nr:DNA glycosylase [Mycena rebaudengoi]